MLNRAKEGKGRWITAAGVLLGLALPSAAGAAPAVTTTADSSAPGSGSLRASIAGAASVDTVFVPAGTYHLTLGELAFAKQLTITGAGPGATVIDGGGLIRVFHVSLPAGSAAALTATIQNLTVTGGNVTGNGGGGGILNDTGGVLAIRNSVITGNSATGPGRSAGDGGAGIRNESSGGLNIATSTVSGNTLSLPGTATTSGGAGIWTSPGPVTIDSSTISGNTMSIVGGGSQQGGGGIHIAGGGPVTIQNSTISGNQATVVLPGVGNGGGGIWTEVQTRLANTTIAGNTTNGAGGGLMAFAVQAPSPAIGLQNSIVAGNSLGGCAVAQAAALITLGSNMETGTNDCALGASDFPGVDPLLGPLAFNGGPTQTHALPAGSLAIDKATPSNCKPPGNDQRGLARAKGSTCDIGAYEFDGVSGGAEGCSPNGIFSLALSPPAGASAVAARFRVDGGAESSAPPGAVPVPEGSHSLEYWGEFTSGQELAHHTDSVIVDPTPPLVDIVSNQGKFGYTVGETASFHVTASDAASGLSTDPTAGDTALDTSGAGELPVSRTATDNCGNSATASQTFKVLPKPEYGKEVNLVPVDGEVFVAIGLRARKGRAQASQKGVHFVPLEEARQVPVGSLVDTRKGTAQLVSARNPDASRLQSGNFAAGIFQVLQSRKKKAKGLTELRLTGASFSSCTAKARKRGKRAAASKLSSRTIRRLRGDAHGSFRTRGKHSAATVRGTKWTVADRCDGTLTSVSRGKVAVRDFRRKKTVLVRAGKSYLAKAPG